MEERLIELETRLAYHEATVETLSAELARQQRLIEQMQIAIRQLVERLSRPADGVSGGRAGDEIPPQD